jgi:ubiquinone/menaquinone biosynthesis C-methylase UbiE
MGFYRRKVLPFIMDKAMDNEAFHGYRRELLASARGRVLEIGFGTGLNAPFFPSAVERVVAIDPNEGMQKRAAARIAGAPVPIEMRLAAGEKLPADDASFDCVVTSLVLCSVDDVDKTLAEIARVLKPGGHYLLLEHGLCDDPKVQKWQHRLNGFQQRVFGGCQLTRPIRKSVEQGGFRFESARDFYMEKAPKFGAFCTMGTAVRQ